LVVICLFSPLRKAVASLERAIVRSQGARADEELRDAVIQRFEYTFELCWKMLRRVLAKDSAVPAEIDRMSYKDLLRHAGQRGFVDDVELWLVFRNQRNITSHTYDSDKANSVRETAVSFHAHALALLEILERTNDD